MKSLKIHLVWFVIAIVLGGAVGLFLAARERDRSQTRERKHLEQVRALRAKIAALDKRLAAIGTSPDSVPLDPTYDETGTPASESGDSTRRRGRKRDEQPLSPEQIRAFLKGTDRGDRKRALKAIDRMKDRAQKIAFLREVLAMDDRRMKEDAVRMLDDIGAPEGIELAASILRNEESSSLRERAVRELGDIGGPQAVAALQSALGDESSSVRSRIARELGDIGGPQAMAALQSAFGDESLEVRTRVAIELRDLGDPAPAQQLIHYISPNLRDQDGALREDTVRILGNVGTPSSLPLLQEALRDPNSDVRREAVDALRDTKLEGALPILQQALNDPHPSVVRDAQRAIERLQKAAEEASRKQR